MEHHCMLRPVMQSFFFRCAGAGIHINNRTTALSGLEFNTLALQYTAKK